MKIVKSDISLLFSIFQAIPELSRPPVLRVFLKQVYFTGIESIFVVLFLAVTLAALITSQLMISFGINADLSSNILAVLITTTLAPFFTGMILVARSNTAISIEIASMQVNFEILSLYRIGIDPIAYLFMPRLLAMAVCSMVLSILFAFTALITGSTMVYLMGSRSGLIDLTEYLAFSDIVLLVLKGIIFGVFISLTAILTGLKAKTSTTQIPVAASKSVMIAFLGIFILDGILTILFKLF